MKKKIVFTIVMTFLVTTLFWLLVQNYAGSYVRQEIAKKIQALEEADLEEAVAELNEATPAEEVEEMSADEQLIGKWKPVEASDYTIEITKYGKANLWGKYGIKEEYEWSTKDGVLKIFIHEMRYKHYEQNGSTYLELYDDAELAGKYRKVK